MVGIKDWRASLRQRRQGGRGLPCRAGRLPGPKEHPSVHCRARGARPEAHADADKSPTFHLASDKARPPRQPASSLPSPYKLPSCSSTPILLSPALSEPFFRMLPTVVMAAPLAASASFVAVAEALHRVASKASVGGFEGRDCALQRLAGPAWPSQALAAAPQCSQTPRAAVLWWPPPG